MDSTASRLAPVLVNQFLLTMKPVTPQEKNILELIAQGFPTRKIARVLNISFHTVQSHRKNLLLKFGAANTAELVCKAMETNNLRKTNTETSPHKI